MIWRGTRDVEVDAGRHRSLLGAVKHDQRVHAEKPPRAYPPDRRSIPLKPPLLDTSAQERGIVLACTVVISRATDQPFRPLCADQRLPSRTARSLETLGSLHACVSVGRSWDRWRECSATKGPPDPATCAASSYAVIQGSVRSSNQDETRLAALQV